MSLEISQAINDALQAVNSAGAPINETAMMGKIRVAAQPALDSESEAARLGAYADTVAFQFQRSLTTEGRTWGIYWTELASGAYADGRPFLNPDIATISQEIIDHWVWRSETLSHPILVSRYADLVWEIGKYRGRPSSADSADGARPKTPPVSLAHRAIDAYLQAVNQQLYNSEFFAWAYIDRAIELAATVNDSERLTKLKTALFALKDKLAGEEGRFAWWRFDDILWSRAKHLHLDAANIGQAIAVLECALTRASDTSNPETFDPHVALKAADRLARRRAQTKEPEEAARALKAAALAQEAAAGLAEGMTAIALLEELLPRYRAAGMPDDVARVEAAIRGQAERARGEMKLYSVPVNISMEEMDHWSDQFLQGTLAEGLERLARDCLLKEDAAQLQLKDLAKTAPVWAALQSGGMGNEGFTIAKVGSIDDDMEGRAIQHAANLFAWHAPFLRYALNRIKEKHELTLEKLLAVTRDCGFFKPEREPLLAEGIAAWLAGDSVKAIHVLIPQIEAALRDLLAAVGAPVTEPDHNNGGFMMIGFGKILSHEVFGDDALKDIRFHLRSLYIDNRGINLRNNLAHGLASADLLNAGTADWVMHTIFMIGSLRFREPGAPHEAPSANFPKSPAGNNEADK